MSRLSHAVGLTCVLMTIAAGRVPALRLVPTLPPGSAFNADLGTGYDAVLVTKYAARCPDDGAR